MTTIRFFDLIVVNGPDKGMRYSIEEGTYRIIGQNDNTLLHHEQNTAEGDRILNPDQQEIIYLHIKNYSDSSRLQFHVRGPDILLNDTSISRMHAIVLFDRLTASIANLNGTDNINVNNNPIKEAKLKEGDIISIGQTQFMTLIE